VLPAGYLLAICLAGVIVVLTLASYTSTEPALFCNSNITSRWYQLALPIKSGMRGISA
jgi:hypothetical protein